MSRTDALYELPLPDGSASASEGVGEDPRASAGHTSPYQVYVWASVLLDEALRSLHSPVERTDTLAWLDSDSPDAGSFHYCCGVLGFDPESLRLKLKEGTTLAFSAEGGASTTIPDS